MGAPLVRRFWHPWACAGNVTGCPWVGHGNASRLFEDYVGTVGHGWTLNLNSPPDRSGRMNASVAATMRSLGQARSREPRTTSSSCAPRLASSPPLSSIVATSQAVQKTFGTAVASAGPAPAAVGACAEGMAEVRAAGGGALPPFDYVVSMEGLERGQRIANYSVEYQARARGHRIAQEPASPLF